MIKKALKAVAVVVVVVFIGAVAFVPASPVSGATFNFIYTNYSNGSYQIITNTITTVNPVSSGGSSSFIYSNYSNGAWSITTNTLTSPVQNVPYFPYANGFIYGGSGGSLGFFGTSPATQQVTTAAVSVTEANTTTVSNLVTSVNALLAALKNLGLSH